MDYWLPVLFLSRFPHPCHLTLQDLLLKFPTSLMLHLAIWLTLANNTWVEVIAWKFPVLVCPPEVTLRRVSPSSCCLSYAALELTLIDRSKCKKEFRPSWTQLKTELPSQHLLDQPTSTWKLYLCKKKVLLFWANNHWGGVLLFRKANLHKV